MKTGTDALGALSGTQGGSMSECEVVSGAYSGQGASPEAAFTLFTQACEATL